MPENYNSDRLGQELAKIKIKYEQRIYEHSHGGEKHFVEIFRYVVENVLWEVLTQRKKELEQRKYIVNISRHFPDDSDPTPFVKMELSPAPAFCTGDAPNEDKSMPVYEWLARPNARAGLVEILHHSHAVHRPNSACRLLRTLCDWWYTDRITAGQLTTEYVESSIDEWAISSIQHYFRWKSRRSGMNSFQHTQRASSKKRGFLPTITWGVIFFSMILFVVFLGWKNEQIWLLKIFVVVFFGLIFVLAWITGSSTDKLEFIRNLRKIYYRFVHNLLRLFYFYR